MAYWQRRRNYVDVYYYDSKLKKNVKVPRLTTQHLDELEDEEIDAWVEDWDKHHGITSDRARRRTVWTTDKLRKLITAYQNERKIEDGVGSKTLVTELGYFENYILPYFVGEKKAKDVRKWNKVGVDFRSWLTQETPLQATTKKQIIQTVNRFGKWLKDRNIIHNLWHLKSPKTGRNRIDRKTPLPREVRPEEILMAANHLKRKHPDWALAILCGYFACLRPEETLALTREDFLTGQDAMYESQTYDRLRQQDLGSTLAVDVNKALIVNKELGPPKNYNSNGVVSIWSRAGAKLIGSILRELPSGPIYHHCKTWLFTLYNKIVRPHLEITMHDLRRSSALYLGRTIGLEPFLLQDQLRHADMDTTMQYTRRPGNVNKSARQQNFDDIE